MLFRSSKMGYEYEDMNALMRDSAMHRLEGVSAAEADAKIRELMFNLLELTPETVENKKMYRRAMARNKDKFFEVIEEAKIEEWLLCRQDGRQFSPYQNYFCKQPLPWE